MGTRIGTRLAAGFALIAMLLAVLALYSLIISQISLRQAVGKSSTFLAEEMLKQIDSNIFRKLEHLQRYAKCLRLQNALSDSNREFEKLDDVESYMLQRDGDWASVPEDEVTPFMQNLIGNQLSENLRTEFIRFYREKYGYAVYAEVFAPIGTAPTSLRAGKPLTTGRMMKIGGRLPEREAYMWVMLSMMKVPRHMLFRSLSESMINGATLQVS